MVTSRLAILYAPGLGRVCLQIRKEMQCSQMSNKTNEQQNKTTKLQIPGPGLQYNTTLGDKTYTRSFFL